MQAGDDVVVPTPIVCWSFKEMQIGICSDCIVRDGTTTLPFEVIRELEPQQPLEGSSPPIAWSILVDIVLAWAQMRAQGKGRTERRLLRLVSELQWPVENAFVHSKFETKSFRFLLTHYAASSSLPYMGRIYISCDCIWFHMGGLWSETKE
jgi:hypothetical protein